MEHVFRGYAAVRDGDEVVWRSELLENALMDQGEQEVLNVFLREQAHKTKYLGLFNLGTDPVENDTVSTLMAGETKTPGVGGYSRQQVLAADWGVPALIGGDYRTETTGKVFGPFSGTVALITHVVMLTTETGVVSPSTLALAHLAIGTQISIAVGLTFTFTPVMGAF